MTADDACTCYVTPESYWFVHYGAVEPGSQLEPNYDCPKHFPKPTPVSDRLAANSKRAWEAAHGPTP